LKDLEGHESQHEYTSTLRLITLEEAQAAIHESLINYKPCIEEISLVESPGRILAEDIYAPSNVPPKELAALDGIAVNSKDLLHASHKNPVKLYLKKSYVDSLRSGEAVPIATGMALPRGADAVVRSENFKVEGEYVRIIEKVMPGKDVIQKGEEVREGELLLKAGSIITPEITGLLMELSFEKIHVFRKPRLAIISVGNELFEGYQERGLEAINYSYIISRKSLEAGADVVSISVVHDDEVEFKNKLLELSRNCDVIFTTGGCSIGPNDIVPKAIKSISGAKIIFHGVRCYPAKPTGYAVVNNIPVLMMPGHVVSMYVCYQIFGKKIINLLSGVNESINSCPAILDLDVKGKAGLTSIILISLELRNGELHAVPLKSRPSSFSSLLRVNGYLLVDNDKTIKAGEKILVNLVR